jgi:replication factor C small subunit
MIQQIWTEKYRPSTLDGYVFSDSQQRKQINTWIKEKTIPHLLFSGSPGIGKTTIAKILINELEVMEFDILEINASRTNSVDDVRDKITNFVQMMPFGSFKVVLLDEADYLSPNAQAALRGVMEEYAATARFILTCNYPNKIIPALHSRCQGFHITNIDQTEFTTRVATILITENVEFELDVLDTFVRATYPDLRKCINSVQQNVSDGQLNLPVSDANTSTDWRFEMVNLFKESRIREARTLLCGKLQAEEMLSVYRWIYDNINVLSNDRDIQDKILFAVKRGLLDHTLVMDPEINLSATLLKIAIIIG